jgi:hypothetical protein
LAMATVNRISNNTMKCFFIITPIMFLNLQIITLQYVRGYKQKTPRMWGFK